MGAFHEEIDIVVDSHGDVEGGEEGEDVDLPCPSAHGK